MKNQYRSELHREYNSQVKMYNEINDRVVRNKLEMSYLWKYKSDYPADWRRKAEMLSNDRVEMCTIKNRIISILYA